MTLAKLALLVAAYLSLDVANPMMPGALTFGVEESVEARQADRFRGRDAGVAPLPRAPEPERLDPSGRPLALSRLPGPQTSRPGRLPVTRSGLSLPPAAPAEDH
jgi:hypothetical protein